VSAFATLGTLEERGYRASLDLSELVVKGPGPVPEDLRRELVTDTAAIKAAVLISNPPGWLEKLFDLYLSGQQTPVRFTNPASGKSEVFMVSVSIKNICTAVAGEIGAPVLEWERLRPEVEEVLGKWRAGTKEEA
jgi:hypothetical protein